MTFPHHLPQVVPARTPDGQLHPPRPPFRLRQRDAGGRDKYRSSYVEDDTGYDEDRRRGYRSDGSEDDDDDGRDRAVDPAAEITDRHGHLTRAQHSTYWRCVLFAPHGSDRRALSSVPHRLRRTRFASGSCAVGVGLTRRGARRAHVSGVFPSPPPARLQLGRNAWQYLHTRLTAVE